MKYETQKSHFSYWPPYFIIYYIYIGQFFAINAKIKNIVFLITLKAKKAFFKELSRFNKIFSAKKYKN